MVIIPPFISFQIQLNMHQRHIFSLYKQAHAVLRPQYLSSIERTCRSRSIHTLRTPLEYTHLRKLSTYYNAWQVRFYAQISNQMQEVDSLDDDDDNTKSATYSKLDTEEIKSQLTVLLHRADKFRSDIKGKQLTDKFATDRLEFLKNAAQILALSKTGALNQSALPLCEFIYYNYPIASKTMRDNNPRINNYFDAHLECLRIFQHLKENDKVIQLTLKLLRNGVHLSNQLLLKSLLCLRQAIVDIPFSRALQRSTSTRMPRRLKYYINQGHEIMDLGFKGGSELSKPIFHMKLYLYGLKGDTSRAKETLDLIESTGDTITSAYLHTLMKGYIFTGHLQHVLAVYNSFGEYGLEPSDSAIGYLMTAYVNKGKIDDAKALLDTLKTDKVKFPMGANNWHYGILLRGFGRLNENRLSLAFQLYEDMKEEKHAKPTLSTISMMMHAIYHSEIPEINEKLVYGAMATISTLVGGAIIVKGGVETLLNDYLYTTLFCTSFLGSMGLAAYMHPDGVRRALYPNDSDTENARQSVVQAFFRRLREEDHAGRAVYIWRDMHKNKITPDDSIFDLFVRTCIKKRHPEFAIEAAYAPGGPLSSEKLTSDFGKAINNAYPFKLETSVYLLRSLLDQKRMNMAKDFYESAQRANAFNECFKDWRTNEEKNNRLYDLRVFGTSKLVSFVMSQILYNLKKEISSQTSSNDMHLPTIKFQMFHGFDVLDVLDKEDVNIRDIFTMHEMKRYSNDKNNNDKNNSEFNEYFEVEVIPERLKEFILLPDPTAISKF